MSQSDDLDREFEQLHQTIKKLNECDARIEANRLQLGEAGFEAVTHLSNAANLLSKYETFAAAHAEHENRYFVYGINQSSGFYESRANVIRLREVATKASRDLVESALKGR